MRGQQSLEYLVIVAITIGLILAGMVFYFAYTKDKEAQAISAQIESIGHEVMEHARQTYLLGYGARETLIVNLPGSIHRIYVDPTSPYEFVIRYETSYGMTEAVFFASTVLVPPYADGNVTNAKKGNIEVQFDSHGNNVSLRVIDEF